MTTRILIMGLPGAGKTTLAQELQKELYERDYSVEWINADEVRSRYNDWDFSEQGRIRQSRRMRKLADQSSADFVICDFVAPLPEMRDAFDAHMTVWVDTIDSSRYADTDQLFVPPTKYNYRIMSKASQKWAPTIANKLSITYKHHKESHARSVTKTVTWRITGSGSTFLISFLITGSIAVAGTILGIHFFANTLLYYFHERIWNKIRWGKHEE